MAQQPNPNRSGAQVLSDNNPAGSSIGEENNVFTGRNQQAKGEDVVSANDITVGNGNYFRITGTTTVQRMAITDWQDGAEVMLYLTGACTLQNGVAAGGVFQGFALASSSSITTGNVLVKVILDGTVWRQSGTPVSYTPPA